MKRPARLKSSKFKNQNSKLKIKSKNLFFQHLVEFFVIVPVLLICIVGYGFWNFPKATAASGINKQINFQGKLVDNNGLNVADTTYTVVFSLYSVASGGSAIWTESDSVTTSNGVFQVALGANTALPANVDFNSDSIYLGIKVNSDAEMTPRVRFSAVPYAFNAAALDGIVATNSATQFTITGGTNALLDLTVNGSLTLGSTIKPTASGGITLDTNGANALGIGTNANAITFGATNNPTYAFNGNGSVTFQGTSFTLGNGSSSTIQTTSNAGLSLLSAGAGNITLGQNTGNGTVVVQPNAGGQASFIVNNQGSGDILTASQGAKSVFTVARGTGSVVNGFTFTGSATNTAVSETASGADTNIGLTIDAKGNGGVTINGTGTGAVTVGHGLTLTSGTTLTLTGDTITGAPTWSSNQAITLSTASQPNVTSLGTLTGLTVAGTAGITSTSATAFTVASSGTNYGLQVDESASSAVTGIKIAAAATGGTTALTVLDTGATSNLSIDAKGVGAITIGGTSTGNVVLGNSSSAAVKLGKFGTQNGVLYVSATDGTVAETGVNSGTTQCLTQASSGAPTWGSCITGTGQDLTQGTSSLSPATLAATSTLIGTVSVTPSTSTGDLWVQAQLWSNSLSNTDQTITWELRSGSNCSGTIVDTETSSLTSSNASNGPSGYLSYVTANPGASAQTYAVCGKSTVASGASAGGLATATVIDNVGAQGPQGPAGATQWQEVANSGALTYITPATATDALSIGVIGSGSNVVPWSGLYVESNQFNTKGNALVAINQTGLGDSFTASVAGVTQFVLTNGGTTVLGTGVKSTDALTSSALTIKDNGLGNSSLVINQIGAGDIFTASSSGTPVFTVGKVTGTAANGFTFTGSSTTNAVAQAATGTDINIGLTIDSKGSGTVTINGTGTGVTTIGHGLTLTSGTTLTLTGDTITGAPTWSSNQGITLSTASQPNVTSLGTLTGLTVAGTGGVTSTSATAFTVASSGTNYGLQIDESASSAVTGIKIAAAATGGTTALTVLDTGANSSLSINAKGTGTIGIGGTSTGTITLGNNGGIGNVVIQPNAGGQAALIVNDQSVGDIFTASTSGSTKFRITNAGNVLFQGDTISSSSSASVANNGSGVVVSALGDQGSMVPNAGFEANNSNSAFADGWVVVATNSAAVTRDTTIQVKGGASARITLNNSSTAFYSSCIPLNGNISAIYTLNWYAKSNANTPTVRAYIDGYATKADCQNNKMIQAPVAVATQATTTSWALYGTGTTGMPNTNFGSTMTYGRVHFFVATASNTFINIDGVRLTEKDSGQGLDYAENYPADPIYKPQPGDVVMLTSVDKVTMVKKADKPNDPRVLGVVSTNPGEVLDDGSIQEPVVPIALAGRIPTKVSTQNGHITIGDYLTSSDIPGVAVKAIGPGPVIGTAMEEYSSDDPTEIGSVVMFVKNSYYAGDTNGLTGGSAGIADLIGSFRAESIHTNDLAAQSIHGAIADFDMATMKEATISALIAQNISASSFIIQDQTGLNKVKFDDQGNGFFAGTVTADKIVANNIEGLTISASQIDDLNTSIDKEIQKYLSSFIPSTTATPAATTEESTTHLADKESATISGDVRVKGNGLIEGILHVVSNLITNNILVNGLAEFFDKAKFHKDVAIDGHVAVLGDTAGTVVVKKDERKVDVTFAIPYDYPPIVTASLLLNQENATNAALLQNTFFQQKYTFVVTDVTEKGFSLLLNKPAITDVILTWTAFGRGIVTPTPE